MNLWSTVGVYLSRVLRVGGEMDGPTGIQRIHTGCWIDWDPKGLWRYQHFERLSARTFRLLAYSLQ